MDGEARCLRYGKRHRSATVRWLGIIVLRRYGSVRDAKPSSYCIIIIIIIVISMQGLMTGRAIVIVLRPYGTVRHRSATVRLGIIVLRWYGTVHDAEPSHNHHRGIIIIVISMNGWFRNPRMVKRRRHGTVRFVS